MTIKQALTATISISGVDDTLIEKSLLDADVSPEVIYTKAEKKNVDLVAIEVLKSLISLADISEGDMSITYDSEAIKARLLFLASQYPEVNISFLKPTITSRNVW